MVYVWGYLAIGLLNALAFNIKHRFYSFGELLGLTEFLFNTLCWPIQVLYRLVALTSALRSRLAEKLD